MRVSELIERLQRHLEINGRYADYPVLIAKEGGSEEVVTTMRVSTNYILFTETTRCKCSWCAQND